MSRLRINFFLLSLALLVTQQLHAQDKPALASFLQQSQSRGAPPEFVQEVLGEARSLQERGIPAEPFLTKASEGLVKGMSPERIRPAIHKTRQQLEQGDQWVNRAVAAGATMPSPEERRSAISQYQKALMVGVGPAALNNLEKRGKGPWQVSSLARRARNLSLKKYNNLPPDGKSGGWWHRYLSSEKEIQDGIPNKGKLKLKLEKGSSKKPQWKKGEENEKWRLKEKELDDDDGDGRGGGNKGPSTSKGKAKGKGKKNL